MITPDFDNNFYLMDIDRKGNTNIVYNGLLLGYFNYSPACKSYFLYMRNISDCIVECNSVEHCTITAKNLFTEWLNGCEATREQLPL